MEVLIDTNFIIACVKQKIDLTEAEEQLNEKINWIVPQEVLDEIEDIKDRKKSNLSDRNAAKLSLEIIRLLNPKIIEIKNPNTDQGIINYIEDKKIVLATLDKKLKNKTNNKKMIIKGKKKLDVI